MTRTEDGSPAWIKDVLAFGHNIGLALVLAAFGAMAFHIETVRGTPDWNRYLAGVCIIVAVLWGGLSSNLLAEQLLRHTRWRSRAWARTIVGGLAIGLGASVVLLAPAIPDNNHIVSVCERYAEAISDPIHKSEECQRLYDRRAEYERRLRGE